MSKLTPEQQQALLDEFEQMLGEQLDEETTEEINKWMKMDDNDGLLSVWDSDEEIDLEYEEDEDEVLNQKKKEIEDRKKPKCEHKNTKRVVISHNIKYLLCTDCKADLGDID